MKKEFYLTIDDGPSILIEDLLKLLNFYNVKATFFVTGQWEKYEYGIQEILKHGHLCVPHTFSHVYKEIYSSSEKFWEDFDKIFEVIKKYQSYVPAFFRFAGGSDNTVSNRYNLNIMKKLKEEAKEKKLNYIDWNASNGDTEFKGNAEQYFDFAKMEIGNQTKVVFLIHNLINKNSLESLNLLIPYLKEQNFEFKLLTEDIQCIR